MQVKRTSPSVGFSAWYSLAVLTLIYTCHAVDRSIMSIVVEPLKGEFGLSDSQIGILTGLAYAFFYSLAGIPIGYLIDRVNRRNLLAILVTIWSVFTAVCGMTQNYWQLLVARLAVGASEAGAAPTALSMIGDIFPEEKRSGAISIFWLSTAFGTALSFGMGGYVAVQYGWRAAFFVAGTPGILLALLLFFTVREPEHGASDEQNTDRVEENTETAPPLGETLKYAISRPAIRHIFIAVAFKSCVLSGVLVWIASYFIRTQGLPIAKAGIVVGMSIAVFGGIGSVLGGVIGDKIYRRGGLKMLPMIPFFSSAITAILVLILAFAPNLYVAIGAFAAFEIASRIYTAPSYSFLISNIPSRMRGVNISAMQIGSNLIGYGLGPFIVGVVSDMVGGVDSIRYGLAALAVISLWVSFHFYRASAGLKLEPESAS